MTIVEITLVGLCAIVADREIECKTLETPGKDVEPFDVVLLDPEEAPHLAELWIRADGLELSGDEKCYFGKEFDGGDLKTEAPNCDCSADEPCRKWAYYDLSGMELQIPQAGGKARLETGRRKVGTGKDCWLGDRPSEENCSGPQDDCEKDVSWLPDYTKAVGAGRVPKKLLSHPDRRFISAIVRDLGGTLESSPQSREKWDQKVVKWQWNDPSCEDKASVPDYQQQFSRKAVIDGVKLKDNAIFLVDLKGRKYGEREIKLKPSTPEDPTRVAISNLPVEKPEMVNRDGKCASPHFDYFRLLLTSVPDCRRIPYVDCDEQASQDSALPGMPPHPDDPFCPPTIVIGFD